MNATELKARLIRTLNAVRADASAYNAKIVNETAAQLFALTGEVLVGAQFVKVR